MEENKGTFAREETRRWRRCQDFWSALLHFAPLLISEGVRVVIDRFNFIAPSVRAPSLNPTPQNHCDGGRGWRAMTKTLRSLHRHSRPGWSPSTQKLSNHPSEKKQKKRFGLFWTCSEYSWVPKTNLRALLISLTPCEFLICDDSLSEKSTIARPADLIT